MDLQTLLEKAEEHPRMLYVQVASPFKMIEDDGRWWITYAMESEDTAKTFKNASLSKAKEMAETYLAALPHALLPEEDYVGMTDQEILDLPPFAAED